MTPTSNWRRAQGGKSCGAACRSTTSSPAPARPRSQPGEILVGVECDALPGYGGSFEKVGHRRSLVISLVCLAALVKLDAAGRALRGRAAGDRRHRPGAAAARRGRGLPARRRGQRRRGWSRRPTCRSIWSQSRTRQDYRRDVVRGFVLRGLIDAVQRAGADPTVLAPRAGGGLCLTSHRGHRQRPQGCAQRQAAPAAARLPARRPQPDRHQGRLRRRRMRHLLGVRRRRAGEILPDAGRQGAGRRRSRPSRGWPAAANCPCCRRRSTRPAPASAATASPAW